MKNKNLDEQLLEKSMADQIKLLEEDLSNPSNFKTKNEWKNIITIKEGDDCVDRNE